MMEKVVDPEDGVAPGAAGPGLPGRRQDRHRPAGRQGVRLLRRHVHRLLRRASPPPTTRASPSTSWCSAPATAAAAARSAARRSQDHGLRAAALRRPADRHEALRPPGRVGSARWRVTPLARSNVAIVPELRDGTVRPAHPPRTALGRAAPARLPGGPPRSSGTGDTVVTGISLSSQRVLPGDLYAALPGARAHGIEYVADAAGRRGRRGPHRPARARRARRRAARRRRRRSRARCWAASPPRSTAARPSACG